MKKHECDGCYHYRGCGHPDYKCCNYIFDVGTRRPCPPGKDCTVRLEDNAVKRLTYRINNVKPKLQPKREYKPLCKPVRCITTGETFPSAVEAAKKYGIDKSGISKCCKGIAKHCGGKEWAFVN